VKSVFWFKVLIIIFISCELSFLAVIWNEGGKGREWGGGGGRWKGGGAMGKIQSPILNIFPVCKLSLFAVIWSEGRKRRGRGVFIT
jgi:hypothetical protein